MSSVDVLPGGCSLAVYESGSQIHERFGTTSRGSGGSKRHEIADRQGFMIASEE